MSKSSNLKGKFSFKKGKKEQASLSIAPYKKESVLGDENRFFKGEMEEAKRSIFFQ